MSEKRNRVVIFEDDPDWVLRISAVLKNSGFEIVKIITSLQEVNEFIPQMANLSIDLAVIDGNLRKGQVSGEDGKIINLLVKEKSPSTYRLGFSASYSGVEGVDLNLGKDTSPNVFIETVVKVLSAS